MEFEKFVKPVSDYINFLINFWFEEATELVVFAGAGEVVPFSILMLSVGVGFYLVLSFTPMNIIPSRNNIPENFGPKVESNSLLAITATTFVTPVLLEISIYFLGSRTNGLGGDIYDTFNASIFVAAAIFPLTALGSRSTRFALAFSEFASKPARNGAKVINFFIQIVLLIAYINALKAYALFYGSEWHETAVPIIFALCLMALITIVSGAFLFHWNNSLGSDQ